MAGASLLALLDDIATILDDVAVLTKVAAQKTAGVLGDDLALNAQQVSGVRAERELPVVWAVGVGSLKNKLILVPAALAISALVPWAVTPLLMLGGLYLCLEGVEKLAHKWLQCGLHRTGEDETQHTRHLSALAEGGFGSVSTLPLGWRLDWDRGRTARAVEQLKQAKSAADETFTKHRQSVDCILSFIERTKDDVEDNLD